MKTSKKFKFILPVLSITPIIPAAFIATACAKAEEEKGPEATKVTITLDNAELKDKTEFDIKSVKKLQLKAKVEPAQANQDVTFEIVGQEGTGNIACSQTGILYTNGCVGSITIKAISKTKNKLASDPIELIFWNSDQLEYHKVIDEVDPGQPIETMYCTCNVNILESIREVVIPSNVTVNGKQYPVGGVRYGGFNGCISLWYARMPSQSRYFRYLAANCFYQCTSLKKITVPDSVIQIDSNSFSNCTALETIDIGKNVLAISNAAFLNCTSLIEAKLPESLTYIGAEAFRQCSSLKTIVIPAAVATIGESAFANCWNSHIYVDENSQNFYSNEKALYNKSKTRLLQCQYDYTPKSNEDVYTIDDSIKKIDARAFEYCENLQWVEFTSNSQCESIGEYCFALCGNLTHCILPPKITEIKADCFAYCWNLEEINIPESVVLIQKYAFYGCDHLKTVEFYGTSDEAITWTVANISSEPPFTGTVNVHWYQKLQEEDPEYTSEIQKKLNAGYLRSIGYYENPESPQKKWVGGYANCIWAKNNIPVHTVGPVSSDILFSDDNPKFVNLGSSSITIKITFAKVVTTAEYKLSLYNQKGFLVSDDVFDLTCETPNTTKSYTFKFRSSIETTDEISAIISKI